MPFPKNIFSLFFYTAETVTHFNSKFCGILHVQEIGKIKWGRGKHLGTCGL